MNLAASVSARAVMSENAVYRTPGAANSPPSTLHKADLQVLMHPMAVHCP